jgi:hypothetical protein
MCVDRYSEPPVVRQGGLKIGRMEGKVIVEFEEAERQPSVLIQLRVNKAESEFPSWSFGCVRVRPPFFPFRIRATPASSPLVTLTRGHRHQ